MTEKLVAMTFEEASRWIAAQEKRIEQLEAARDLAGIATATLRDESIAKNERIATLEAAYAKAYARVGRLDAALRPTEAEIEVASDEWPWQEKTKGEGFRAGIAWMQARVVLLPPLENEVAK